MAEKRRTQESPLVWGLIVAIMLIAFLNFLFLALAEPTTYRAVLALAAGAFLVLSTVQLVRSSRERRRLQGSSSSSPAISGGSGPDTGQGDDRRNDPGEDRSSSTSAG